VVLSTLFPLNLEQVHQGFVDVENNVITSWGCVGGSDGGGARSAGGVRSDLAHEIKLNGME